MTTSTQFSKIKDNAELYNKEKNRVNNINVNRYKTDEEFRNRIIEQQKKRRQMLKELKKSTLSV
jgi:predicted metal-dependent phosphoesterase TrpH